MIPESANWWGHRNGFLHSFTFTISVGWFGCPHRWFSCHVPQCLLRSICTSIGMYLDWWSYPDSGNTFASHFRSFSISCQLAFWNSPSFSERGRIGHISFSSVFVAWSIRVPGRFWPSPSSFSSSYRTPQPLLANSSWTSSNGFLSNHVQAPKSWMWSLTVAHCPDSHSYFGHCCSLVHWVSYSQRHKCSCSHPSSLWSNFAYVTADHARDSIVWQRRRMHPKWYWSQVDAAQMDSLSTMRTAGSSRRYHSRSISASHRPAIWSSSSNSPENQSFTLLDPCGQHFCDGWWVTTHSSSFPN